MRVALVNPRGALFSKQPQLAAFMQASDTMSSFRHFWSAPCLGLLTIAAYCPAQWEVVYWDENQRTFDFGNYDLVCLSAMTVQAPRAYEIAAVYRQRGTPVVMGGIHATLLPQEALRHVDVVLAGEGEVLFPQFVRDFRHGTVQRLYQDDHPGEFDLRRCRIPRYKLLQGYDYPLINLYTTRGCPHRCSFCCASNVYGTRYRRKSNTQILQEIDVITGLFPNTLLLFADDNLFVRRQESKMLLRQLQPLGVRWIAQTDIAVAQDTELLDLMAAAGCQWVVIGFESLSDESLAGLDQRNFKRRHRSEYSRSIQRFQAHGIGVYGTFIVGLDGDTPAIFDQTAAFILDNHLYGANITVPTPLPGTRLREEMLRDGRVGNRGWEAYTLWDVVAQPRSMTTAELEAGLCRLYEEIASPHHAAGRLQALLRQTRALHRTTGNAHG